MRNYAEKDPEKDLPYSRKDLRECYALGKEHFGWRPQGERRQRIATVDF